MQTLYDISFAGNYFVDIVAVFFLFFKLTLIFFILFRALQFPPEAWLRLSLNHASITWISITPSGRVILRTLGDSGHIPANLITSH